MTIEDIITTTKQIIDEYHLDYGHAATTLFRNWLEVTVEAPHGALWVVIGFQTTDTKCLDHFRSAINIKREIADSLTYFNAEEYLLETTNGHPENERPSRLNKLLSDADFLPVLPKNWLRQALTAKE